MSELNRYYRPYRRAHRGQTLVVALAVLFVMLILGGIFVLRVARNLAASARGRDTQDAQALAQAGLDYCNQQLNTTAEGADWRPMPSAPLGNTDPDYVWLEKGFTRLPFNGGRALVRVAYDPHPDNPNGYALRIESIGRQGALPANGSDPTVFVPNGKSPQLRRELIAYKQIGITDYGMFITNKDRRTDSNFLGMPGIGHAAAAVFGDPTVAYHSNGINGTNALYGFPIRANGSLMIGGDAYFYLSSRGASDPRYQQDTIQATGNITLLPTRDVNNDGVINSLDIQAYLNQQIDATTPNPGNAITSSDNPAFNTFNGTFTDGSPNSGIGGVSRSTPNLAPPLIDTQVGNSGVMRYRALTRDSGYWYTVNGQQVNSGQYGLGSGIYVNNPTDLQPETTTPGISGSYSLPADWTNPNAGFAQSYWQGPFYRAPGLLVELLGNMIRLTRSDGQSFLNPDLTVNPQNNGTTLEIPLADMDRQNVTLPNGAKLQIFPHNGDEPSAKRTAAGLPASPFGDPYSYGVNVVLYAEGNIRVKGVYGTITDRSQTMENGNVRKLGRVHLTLVTGGTAYIEGNLERGDGYYDGNTVTMERASTCAILAKDYVCINTSMFTQPANQTNVYTRQTPDVDAFSSELGQTRQSYDMLFNWGVLPGSYTTGGGSSPLFLMLRHAAAAPGPTSINLLFNPALASDPALTPPSSAALYNFPYGASPGSPVTYLLGLKYINNVGLVDPAAIAPRFEQTSFRIDNAAKNLDSLALINTPGYDNVLRFSLDQTLLGLSQAKGYAGGSVGQTDYLLSDVAVQPMDIRVEAAMYAQEKSFFIIPGYDFNPDPDDSRQAYVQRGNVRVSYSSLDTPTQTAAKDIYPFHGEPLDIRITIFGSVAENYAASIGSQNAWLQRWGYIPAQYASSGLSVPDDHHFVHDPGNLAPGQDTTDFRMLIEKSNPNDFEITRGLRYLYNPTFAMPYLNPTDTVLNTDGATPGSAYLTRKQRALRSIDYQVVDPVSNKLLYTIIQVLPAIPRLPVCPNYVYAGDSDRLIGSDITDTDNYTIDISLF